MMARQIDVQMSVSSPSRPYFLDFMYINWVKNTPTSNIKFMQETTKSLNKF